MIGGIIIDYFIVEDENSDDLGKSVKFHIDEEGWQPYGPLIIKGELLLPTYGKI